MTRLSIRSREKVPARVLEIAKVLGKNISEARKRRRLRQEDLAAMAGMTVPTLRAVEAGSIGTGLGAYISTLWALGLDHSLLAVAALEDDAEGQSRERFSLRRGLAQPMISRRRLDDNF